MKWSYVMWFPIIGWVLGSAWLTGGPLPPNRGLYSHISQALAVEMVRTDEVTEELAYLAKKYDEEAAQHDAEAKRYEERAKAIDPLTDSKGYRREGLQIAGESHRTIATELRYRAMIHRLEAERLREKQR